MPTLNTQGGALQPTNNGGQSSDSSQAFGAPTALNSFISTLPSVPNPTPPPPKTLTVVTPKVAQDDLATKQDTTNQVASAVTAQTQNKLAQATQPPVVPGTQPTNTNAQQPQQQTQTSTNISGTSYTPPTNATPVTLPNGVQAYYDNDTQQLTTATGQQLQFNNQAGWIDPTTGLPPAPAGTTNSTTGVPATGDPTTDYLNTQLQKNQTLADQANATHQQQLQQLLNGSFPLTADQQAQVAGLQSQYTQLEALQKQANDNLASATTILGIRNGQQQYAPGLAATSINKVVSDGITKLATLDTQASSAVASLKQGFFNQDYTQINGAYKDLTDAIAAKDDTLNSMQENVQKQVALQTAKIQQQTAQLANQTAAITSIASSALQQSLKADGTIDLDALQSIADANGVDVNALYGAVQKEQQTETTAQQQDAKFASDQLQAQANLAKTNADTANTQASTRKTNIEANAEAPVSPNDPTATAALDPNSQSILAQTGLSVAAFNYLTQGTAALSRLSANDRKAIQAEASAFLNKNGLDYSTFQSQYKAQNAVVQSNIERAANTKVFGGEVSGTTKQFISDVGDDISNLKPAAVAQLFATGQTNNATAQKYAFDLQTMQNDLAGYYAASRGASSPDDADMSAAANVITNGLSGKGAKAFQESIDTNQTKVANVVNESVTNAQKAIWGQFGVGDKYNPSASTANGSGISAGKGTQTNNQFVESTLKSKGLNYDDVIAKAKATIASTPSLKGTQPALDNTTGETVFATPAEISSGSYTPL